MTIENFGFDPTWLIPGIVLTIIGLIIGILMAFEEDDAFYVVPGLGFGALAGLVSLMFIALSATDSYIEDVDSQFESEYGVVLIEDSQDIPNHADPDPSVIQFISPTGGIYSICTATLNESTSVVTVTCDGEELVPAEAE